jgi:hypothetical protein
VQAGKLLLEKIFITSSWADLFDYVLKNVSKIELAILVLLKTSEWIHHIGSCGNSLAISF